jgi:hypothetical protein
MSRGKKSCSGRPMIHMNRLECFEFGHSSKASIILFRHCASIASLDCSDPPRHFLYSREGRSQQRSESSTSRKRRSASPGYRVWQQINTLIRPFPSSPWSKTKMQELRENLCKNFRKQLGHLWCEWGCCVLVERLKEKSSALEEFWQSVCSSQ